MREVTRETAECETQIERALHRSSDLVRELVGDDIVARPRENDRQNRDRFLPIAGESRSALVGAQRNIDHALGVELKVSLVVEYK